MSLSRENNTARPISISADIEVAKNLQIDHGGGDDSALDNDQYTITRSAAASEDAFKKENGRRYHAFADDAYFLPNDDVEAQRLDLQHQCWKVAMNGALCRLPLTENLKNILDVGTGTGIWAIDCAKALPNAQVIGTDLSPIQPNDAPSNCKFVVANAEDAWAFDRKFDYIHTRMLTVGMHDWPRLFKQIWDNLEPGGWLETAEVQFPLHRNSGDEPRPSAWLDWGQYCYDACKRAGIDTMASEQFSEQLKAQGFVNIDVVRMQWPVGPWAKGEQNKRLGRLAMRNNKDAIGALAMALFTRQLGWTKEEVDEHVAKVLEEVDDRSNHFQYSFLLHLAQKPLDAA